MEDILLSNLQIFAHLHSTYVKSNHFSLRIALLISIQPTQIFLNICFSSRLPEHLRRIEYECPLVRWLDVDICLVNAVLIDSSDYDIWTIKPLNILVEVIDELKFCSELFWDEYLEAMWYAIYPSSVYLKSDPSCRKYEKMETFKFFNIFLSYKQ